MNARRDAYAEHAVPAVARLLTLLDRNPDSPTYGCFHRDYWLYKTSDFPDAIRQFGAHSLALVYKHDFPGSSYKGQPKIRDWTVAALDFWASLQHQDGSFDEFYPFERGWVGPTAFNTFTACECLKLLGDEIATDAHDRVITAIVRSARFIAGGGSEADHMANHHAMACLAVWKAYEVTGDESLKDGYERVWRGFLSYHVFEEGWSREYDGIDPGYLSATVSFLGKVYQSNRDPLLLRVLEQSAEMCSYFVYPNGFYGGSLGSRNTQHFYPHGFEVLAAKSPVAAAVAERTLTALDGGGLVPPSIMSDRYVFYRVPELLQAYVDYGGRPHPVPPLPHGRDDFVRFFPKARIFAASRGPHYAIANLAKGGAVKVFDRADGTQILADNGVTGRLTDGRLATTQWIDPNYVIDAGDDGWAVEGKMQIAPSPKVFNLPKNLIFRTILFVLGWSPRFCHFLKGRIRHTLILDQQAAPAGFSRRFTFEGSSIIIVDEITVDPGCRFNSLDIGGDTFLRFVPQSRFFQTPELGVAGNTLESGQVQTLNEERKIIIRTTIDPSGIRREEV